MTAPGADGCLGIVVAWEVIFGDLGVKPQIFVTGVFLIQGIGIILRVTCEEYLSASLGLYCINACLVRGGKYLKSLSRLYILAADGGIS